MEANNIYYHTMLSEEQQMYLAVCKYGFNRYQCFISLLRQAVREDITYKKKGFETLLHKGQVAASEVELSKQWKCSRKTVSHFIDDLNRLGIISTKTNNRTSIHTLICLSHWVAYDQWITNPLYIKPKDRIPNQSYGKVTPNKENFMDGDAQQKIENPLNV